MFQKAFTLIELLVVIAIIGLLSSIIITGLGNTKAKSRIGSAQATMRSLQSVLLTCVSGSSAITIGANETAATWTGAAVCSGGPNYPVLPSTWVYCDGTTGTGCAAVSSQSTGVSFSISVYSSTDSKTVTCNEIKCSVS